MRNLKRLSFFLLSYLFAFFVPVQVFAQTDSGSYGENLTWCWLVETRDIALSYQTKRSVGVRNIFSFEYLFN